MPFSINLSRTPVALRASDGVGIRTRVSRQGIEEVVLDLAQRSEDTHCLVAFPSLPNDLPDGPARLWLEASYESEQGVRLPFMLYVAAYREGKPIGEDRQRFFAGPEEARLALDVAVAAEADRYQLVVYGDRRYRGRLRLRAPRLVVGSTQYALGEGVHVGRPVDVGRRWRQEGRRIVCTSPFGEHWAEMPVGWGLDDVHPAAMAAADWILYAPLTRIAFGVVEPPPQPTLAGRRRHGRNAILSFSIGTDSTAAMTLLPDDTLRYYSQRAFRRYFTRSGAEVELPDPTPWDERLALVAGTTVVPNTFELARIAAGAPLGFGHNFGYAALGLLLADHVDAGVIAFGSVMEQVFLRSGHLFADVVALPGSTSNALRRLLDDAGLFLALPTGGCSEVLTSYISETGRYAGIAISCPRAGPDGAPCGTCFKCFRKLRLEGRTHLPDPDESVLKALEKYPLKSATSVVYAAQRSGFRHPAIDQHLDLDLGFLERYLDYAVEHMLPPRLAEHARSELARLGISPMTSEDERRLRTIGQVFWPERFSWKRAGLSEPGPS